MNLPWFLAENLLKNKMPKAKVKLCKQDGQPWSADVKFDPAFFKLCVSKQFYLQFHLISFDFMA